MKENYPRSIAEIKGAEREFIGKTVTAQGYLAIIANNPILVSSLDYIEIDMPIPDDKFLKLSGLITEDLRNEIGALLHLTGKFGEIKGEAVLEIEESNGFKLIELISKNRYTIEINENDSF